MDPKGIEPSTSALRTRRSPSWATSPFLPYYYSTDWFVCQVLFVRNPRWHFKANERVRDCRKDNMAETGCRKKMRAKTLLLSTSKYRCASDFCGCVRNNLPDIADISCVFLHHILAVLISVSDDDICAGVYFFDKRFACFCIKGLNIFSNLIWS